MPKRSDLPIAYVVGLSDFAGEYAPGPGTGVCFSAFCLPERDHEGADFFIFIGNSEDFLTY